jgi:hypothetical protein
MQQAHFTHRRPSHEKGRADSSGWPEGYFGGSAGTSQVVCPSCYRSVHVRPDADAPACPRCGVKLNIDSESGTEQ